MMARNRCVVEDSERALKRAQRWEELVLFYHHTPGPSGDTPPPPPQECRRSQTPPPVYDLDSSPALHLETLSSRNTPSPPPQEDDDVVPDPRPLAPRGSTAAPWLSSRSSPSTPKGRSAATRPTTHTHTHTRVPTASSQQTGRTLTLTLTHTIFLSQLADFKLTVLITFNYY